MSSKTVAETVTRMAQIMTPNDANILGHVFGGSILAMIAGCNWCSASRSRVWKISLALETNETATKSGLTCARLLMSVRSLAVSAGAARPPPRRFIPLRELSLPPTITVQSTAFNSTSSVLRLR